ncbi:MAG: uroporphyrinogen-III synthase [Pseudoxanthomonas sp.]
MASTDRPGWYVISLRPQGGHAALRAAAARHGGRLLALSPWRLRARDDPATRADLRAALACARVVFTSPAAVRCAARMTALKRRRGQAWIAVGDGTAAALRRAGVAAAVTPMRKDSEGLLALPELQALQDVRVGLVTAPGGRGLLAPLLQQRGAQVLRADVYEREARPLSPRAIAALQRLDAPACVALSSGEALASLLAQLPGEAKAKLLRQPVAAASERLAALARDCGFARIGRAEGPQPAQLVEAAERLAAAAATAHRDR